MTAIAPRTIEPGNSTTMGSGAARSAEAPSGEFWPKSPKTLQEARLTDSEVEVLVLKYLLVTGQATGRDVAAQLKLPFPLIGDFLRKMKQDNLVVYKSSTLHDYVCELTTPAVERAQRFYERSSYFGAAPVPYTEYLASVEEQSLRKQRPTEATFREALRDLLIPDEVLMPLGQAVCAGRALFLFGMPGNGKTSIAERVCASFGPTLWIPRAISIEGEIVRVYDPTIHVELPPLPAQAEQRQVDQRWVRVRRPTIVAGGELTLQNLELTRIDRIGILEAPLQLKANCGVLVIDDLGRQQIRPADLLNRWIIPLERGIDFLNSPSGKKVRMPFDQLIVFSTNLEPADLVDEAFLRRIPYKVRVQDPTEEQYRELVARVAKTMELRLAPDAVDYVLNRYYRPANRPLRCCHARDLLAQVRDYCQFRGRPAEANTETLDAAVKAYFGASL